MMETISNYQRVIDANIAMHSSLAEKYDIDEPHFRPENKNKVETRLIYLVKRTGAKKLLDLGCGTGFIINLAKKHIKEIHGIDVTDAMLNKIDKSGPATVKIFKHDSGSFSVEEDSYDIVTAYSFLHHLYDIEPTLQTAFTALKKGGIFYADLEPNFYFWELINQLNRNGNYDPIVKREIEMVTYVSEDFEKKAGLSKEIVDYAEYGKNVLGGFKEEDLKQKLQQAGFSEVEVFYEWFVGQGAIINDPAISEEDRFRNANIIHELLQRTLPLSKNLYKYVGVFAVK